MYWLSLIVIAIILIGLIVAYKASIYFTQIVMIQNLLIFMIVNIPSLGYPYIINNVFYDLAGAPIYLLNIYRFHTYLTTIYLHADFMHIVGNMLILFFIGMALEERIGKMNTAKLYFITGFLATIGHYLVYLGSPIPAVGASGAIMGIMGSMFILYPKEKIPMFLGPIFLPSVRVDLAVGAFLVMQTGIALIVPQSAVAHEAHFVGFISGMLLAKFAVSGIKIKTKKGKDIKKLKRLAVSEELQTMYKQIIQADEESVKEAWIDHFLKRAKCPKCGNRLNGDICECGYDVWQD